MDLSLLKFQFLQLLPNSSEILLIFYFFLILIIFANFNILNNLKFNTEYKNSNYFLNIFQGWIFFIIINLIFLILLDLSVFNSMIFFSIIFLFLLFIKKNFLLFPKVKFLKLYLVLIPYFFVLISLNPIGYDTLAFWIDLSDFIIHEDKLPVGILHDYYPPGIFFVESILQKLLIDRTYNFYGILSFFYLLCTFIFLSEILKIKNNFFLILIIFFNPALLNVYSFTAYHDFSLGFFIFLVYLIYYLNDFKLVNGKYSNHIVIILSFLPLIKTEGLIHSIFILLSMFIFEKKKNFSLSLYIKFIFIFLPFLIWKFHLVENDMVLRGLTIDKFMNRMNVEIILSFFSSIFSQMIERKAFFGSLIFLFFLYLFYRNEKFSKLSRCILLHILFFNAFLFYFYFGSMAIWEINVAHSFWRYNMQLSFSVIFAYILFFSTFEYKLSFFNKKSINFFLILLIITGPLFVLNKLRRDIFSTQVIIDSNIELISNRIENKTVGINAHHFYGSEYLINLLENYTNNNKIFKVKFDPANIKNNKIEYDIIMYIDKDLILGKNFIYENEGPKKGKITKF